MRRRRVRLRADRPEHHRNGCREARRGGPPTGGRSTGGQLIGGQLTAHPPPGQPRGRQPEGAAPHPGAGLARDVPERLGDRARSTTALEDVEDLWHDLDQALKHRSSQSGVLMPFVRITLSADHPESVRAAVAEGVQNALVSAIGVPKDDRFQIVDAQPATAMHVDRHFLDGDRRDPVVVEISLVHGRTEAMKRALYRAIAANLAEVGVRPEDVLIFLRESGRETCPLAAGRCNCWTRRWCASMGGTRQKPKFGSLVVISDLWVRAGAGFHPG